MERKIEVEVSLEGLRVQENPMFCQGDKNTHFINIKFMEDVVLAGYTLQVFYLPPFPSVTPFVDLFTNVTKDFTFPIPNRALERNGKVKVEFSLSKDNKLVTVNKTFDFEVIRTTNSTSLTAYPEGTLKETIAQQIEKIKGLLADTDNKIAEYNSNASEKTTAFNNNSAEKLKTYNDNDVSKTNIYNQNATEKLRAYNNNDTSKTNTFNENAKNKTIEFDTHVKQTADNTYLEMDKKATEYANTAGERANLKVKEQENLSTQAVTSEGTKQVGLVGTKGTEEIEKIQAAGTQAVGDVTANKDAHVKAVTDEGNKQVSAVGNKGAEEVSKVQSTGEKAVGDVNTNKTANIQAVTNEGTKQIGLTKTEGEKQVGLVRDKGAEQTKLVTDEGAKQITAVTNKGTEEVGKVASEGSKQTGIVNIEGNKVIEQVKNIVAGNEATSNALTLSGKTRAEFEKELQGVAGGYSGNFPLTSAVLNGIYLLPATGKLYVCTQAYNGTSLSAPNSNFEELSVFKNRDRLDNLTGNLTSLEKTVNDIDTTYKEEDKKINSQINKIENIIKESCLKKYGVKFTGSNPVGVRTFDAVGMVANVGVDDEIVANDFDKVSFYNRPVCCGTFNENGKFTVNAYEGEPGFARDGSNGDVYYECTPFYWNGSYEEPVVSALEFEGSILAPMFKNSYEKVYLPCYWASLDSNGKYRSISGSYPNWSSLNIHMNNCRKTNANAHTETIKAHMSEYILQLVEFATKDLQSVMMGVCNMIWENANYITTQETVGKNYVVIAKDKASSYVVGQTITNSTQWDNCRRTITRIEEQQDTNAYLYFEGQEPLSVKSGIKISSFPYKTGTTDNIKASSGSVVSNVDGKHQCKWRGKEAPWAEGFSGLCDILRKIEEDGKHYPYLLKDPKKYNNGTITEDYVKLNYEVPANGGWAKNLGIDPKYPIAAITKEVGASSNTYLSAYYWNGTNPITVAFVGGVWYNGRSCSPVCFHLYSSPSNAYVDRLARLFVTAV